MVDTQFQEWVRRTYQLEITNLNLDERDRLAVEYAAQPVYVNLGEELRALSAAALAAWKEGKGRAADTLAHLTRQHFDGLETRLREEAKRNHRCLDTQLPTRTCSCAGNAPRGDHGFDCPAELEHATVVGAFEREATKRGLRVEYLSVGGIYRLSWEVAPLPKARKPARSRPRKA